MTAQPLGAELSSAAIEKLNLSRRRPMLFIHGLWLLPSSWARWCTFFEDQGFSTFAPSWPGDHASAESARTDLDRASETLEQVVDALAKLVGALDQQPIIIGHSFGGLIAQLLADRELSSATVAISPAAFRGVLPLPLSALRSASPVLRSPSNRHKVVPLTFDQFRYAFANAVSEEEASRLFQEFIVPAPGGPLFEAAFANINPWTDDRLDTRRPRRGRLLLIAGEQDHVVPAAVVEAEYKLQKRNTSPTELRVLAGKGHSLVIDSGWKDVAALALQFASKSVGTPAGPHPTSSGEAPG